MSCGAISVVQEDKPWQWDHLLTELQSDLKEHVQDVTWLQRAILCAYNMYTSGILCVYSVCGCTCLQVHVSEGIYILYYIQTHTYIMYPWHLCSNVCSLKGFLFSCVIYNYTYNMAMLYCTVLLLQCTMYRMMTYFWWCILLVHTSHVSCTATQDTCAVKAT